MKMRIGIKTKDVMYDGEDKVESDVIELISSDRNVGFNIKRIVKLKEHLKGKNLSMHSQTSRVFSCDKVYDLPDFVEIELNVLRAEIILCKILGAKELIFHLRNGKLDDPEIKALGKLFNFAKRNNVEMIYESNFGFVGKETIAVLKEFPELNYNFDIGHFNIAVSKNTLGMEVEEFISKVEDRMIYVHVHNNNGVSDSHSSLLSGTLDWKRIFSLLDFKKIRKVIIEVWGTQGLLETKELIEEYFRNE